MKIMDFMMIAAGVVLLAIFSIAIINIVVEVFFDLLAL